MCWAHNLSQLWISLLAITVAFQAHRLIARRRVVALLLHMGLIFSFRAAAIHRTLVVTHWLKLAGSEPGATSPPPGQGPGV